MILLGAPGSGKTTFTRLVSDQSKFPTENIATDGISITKAKNITFWDFGGQEVLLSTHKFFLVDRCQCILVDDQCLRNLIEYLFSPPSNNIVRSELKKFYYSQKIFSIWHSAARTVEHRCKLIPYIINFLEQTQTLDIRQDIYFSIFDIMIASEEGKFLIIPKHFYILLFNRIKFDNFNYQNRIKYLQNCVNKIIKLEDDEYNKSFVIQILGLYYWKDILDFQIFCFWKSKFCILYIQIIFF